MKCCTAKEGRSPSLLARECKARELSENRLPGAQLLAEAIPILTQTTCIDLDVTDGCNLACTYCFKNLDQPINMTLATAKDAVEWLFRASGGCNPVTVNFMGGEPVLRFAMIRELVNWGNRRARAVGKTISWSLTSNLTLWTDEFREWIDKYNVGVLMSIDGHPLIQDSQRPAKDGQPKADIVAKWARSLLKTRPTSSARFTIAPKYAHLLADGCLYLWEEIGFQGVLLAEADYDNWTEEHFEQFGTGLDHIVEYLALQFQQNRPKGLEKFRQHIKRLIWPRDTAKPVERRDSPCGAGYNYSMIDQHGTIWPCHRFDGAAADTGTEDIMRLGNIYTQPYNERLANAFRSFDHSKVHKAQCPDCPLEPRCAGGCPAANVQHGMNNIYTPPDGYCRLQKIVYQRSQDLYARMKAIDNDRCQQAVESWVVP